MNPISDATTHHVRAACKGDVESIDWVIRRLTPHLLTQARWHLRSLQRGDRAPEDLVQEVWAVAFLRLEELEPRDGRMTPVLVAFLARTMRNKALNWLRQRAGVGGAPTADVSAGELVDTLSKSTLAVIRQVVANEADDLVTRAIARMDAVDQEILILRGLEQTSYDDLAVVLGVSAGSLRMRYARARERLREQLPESLFDEIDP